MMAAPDKPWAPVGGASAACSTATAARLGSAAPSLLRRLPSVEAPGTVSRSAWSDLEPRKSTEPQARVRGAKEEEARKKKRRKDEATTVGPRVTGTRVRVPRLHMVIATRTMYTLLL